MCTCCGRRPRRHRAGWCTTCYNRWTYHGRPPGGPPEPGEFRRIRIEEYAFLLSQGVPRKAVARRLGIGMSTAGRYEAELRRPELGRAA